MVIAAVDKGGQLVSAIEFVQIVNPTDRTLVPDLTNLGQISFLRFALPPNPAELTVNSDLQRHSLRTLLNQRFRAERQRC